MVAVTLTLLVVTEKLAVVFLKLSLEFTRNGAKNKKQLHRVAVVQMEKSC